MTDGCAGFIPLSEVFCGSRDYTCNRNENNAQMNSENSALCEITRFSYDIAILCGYDKVCSNELVFTLKLKRVIIVWDYFRVLASWLDALSF